MLKEIFYKKNEKFEVEFFEDEECTKVFDFKDAENLYIELHNGDVTPLMFLYGKIQNCTLYIPYLPNAQQVEVYSLLNSVLHARGIKLRTLSQIGEVSNRIACIDNTAIFTKINNLSKYIPEYNAVLFLNADCCEKYMQCFQNHHIGLYANDGLDDVTLSGSVNAINEFVKNPIKKLTIFLRHGTQSELQKANKVAKELKEKYGVEEVNLFVLDCLCKYIDFTTSNYTCDLGCSNQFCIKKIITTNSTGILEPQNTERLQVIDCKEVFEEWLNTQNS